MSAGKYNITLDQGSTFVLQVTLEQPAGTPINLSGYTVRSQIRKSYSDTLIGAFTCALVTPASGIFQMALTATQTKLLTEAEYVYDVEISIGSTVTRVLEGIIYVSPEVTQDEVAP